jgi:hypothetical protein
MGKIQYPPTGIQQDKPIQQCFVYGEDLQITFGVSGYFSHDNPTAFEPDPPTGNFVAPPPVTLDGYHAVSQDSTVTFSFVDTANGKTYKNEITIVASKNLCPKPTQYE